MKDVKCVIFDMDGLLTDSEPLWRIAEKEAFKKVGIDLTDEMLTSTMGMRCDEVVKHWYHLYPWQNQTLKEVEIAILAKVQELIEARATPLPGVLHALQWFKQKQIPIALASSSPLGIIQSLVHTLNIEPYFKVMCSAEFEEFGKPHPAVFIAAANYMCVDPKKCLVFEDSLNGLIAAKAAQMKCVVVPAPEHLDDAKFALADAILPSLTLFNGLETI